MDFSSNEFNFRSNASDFRSFSEANLDEQVKVCSDFSVVNRMPSMVRRQKPVHVADTKPQLKPKVGAAGSRRHSSVYEPPTYSKPSSPEKENKTDTKQGEKFCRKQSRKSLHRSKSVSSHPQSNPRVRIQQNPCIGSAACPLLRNSALRKALCKSAGAKLEAGEEIWELT